MKTAILHLEVKMIRCGGFTLGEVPVVIAIVFILAALALPVLENIKRQSQQAGCLNNLKQIGNADLLYVADNKVFIEPSAGQYLGESSEWIGTLVDSASINRNVLLCPTASQPPTTNVMAQYNLNAV